MKKYTTKICKVKKSNYAKNIKKPKYLSVPKDKTARFKRGLCGIGTTK